MSDLTKFLSEVEAREKAATEIFHSAVNGLSKVGTGIPMSPTSEENMVAFARAFVVDYDNALLDCAKLLKIARAAEGMEKAMLAAKAKLMVVSRGDLVEPPRIDEAHDVLANALSAFRQAVEEKP